MTYYDILLIYYTLTLLFILTWWHYMMAFSWQTIRWPSSCPPRTAWAPVAPPQWPLPQVQRSVQSQEAKPSTQSESHTSAWCCRISSMGDSVSLMTTAFVTSMSGCCCLASWIAMARAWRDTRHQRTGHNPHIVAFWLIEYPECVLFSFSPDVGPHHRLLWL